MFVALAAASALVMSSFAWAAEPAAAPAPKVAAKAKKAKKAAPKKAWVKKLQMALDKAGYKVKADGVIGKKTRGAIKAFQKDNGLKVTRPRGQGHLGQAGHD